MRPSVSSKWLVGVMLLIAAAAAVALALGLGAPRPITGAGPRRLAPEDVEASVARTVAAGSARLDATYEPAHGPSVEITGRTSLAGPATELEAAVAGEAPSHVRMTAGGSWLRAPGVSTWVPVPESVTGASGSRGWEDVLRTLDPTGSTVWADGEGRITRVRLARDRAGGVLDVRFSAFGIEVATMPP